MCVTFEIVATKLSGEFCQTSLCLTDRQMSGLVCHGPTRIPSLLCYGGILI